MDKSRRLSLETISRQETATCSGRELHVDALLALLACSSALTSERHGRERFVHGSKDAFAV